VEIHWKFRDKEHAEKVATSGFDYILLEESDKQNVRENMMEAVLNQIQNKPI
jgi:2-keto-3-deoxy-L-rhamnonate aldolase RhmA